MKNKWMFALLLSLALVFCGCGEKGELGEETNSFFAMDTYITFTAYGEQAEAALEEAQEKMKALEGKWSVTDEGSEVYAINHSGGGPVQVSEETVQLAAFAKEMAEKTEGALEPTIYPVLTAWGFTTEENRIPGEDEIRELLEKVDYNQIEVRGNEVGIGADGMLDLGAVAKGYAADVVTELLQEKGIKSALLDIGGNIQAIGAKPDGEKWRLGIRNPFSEERAGILEIADRAVVTSGNYERFFIGEDGNQYGHILNPETGYPAKSGLASVTVIAEEGKLCDALSTSLFVMGLDKAAAFWRSWPNFDMILITEEGEIYITEGIGDAFVPDESYKPKKVHVIEGE